MARETVAQRNERFAKEREARLEAERQEYPVRLMKVLARVSKQSSLELSVNKDLFFFVMDRDSHNSEYEFAYSWDAESQTTLLQLEDTLDELEQAQAEALRVYNVRNEAMRKVREALNDEERELLGL